MGRVWSDARYAYRFRGRGILYHHTSHHTPLFRFAGLVSALSSFSPPPPPPPSLPLSSSSSPGLTLSPFIFRVCNFPKSCFATCTRPRRSPISSTSRFLRFLPSPFSTSCFFSLGRRIAAFQSSGSAG